MNRGIYKIINVFNNKFYVGSAVSFKKRKARHWQRLRQGTHTNKHLQAAWNKYGESAFAFVVIEEVDPATDLLEVENRWLREHVGKDYCYNIALDARAIGLGTYGELNPMYGRTYSHTPEAREKIRAASIGRKHSLQAKRKISEYLINKPKPAEVRAKISATLSGEGNFWYGKKRSEDFVAKISCRVRTTQPDGTEKEYSSISELREELGLKPTTVNRALKSGRLIARGKLKGWRIERV